MFLLQFPFPRRSQCCKPDISFSNCLHMLLLKEFQSPLLESRVVQRNLETLPLSSAAASSPGVQLQSDTMSSRHFGTIPWGQKRVKACFLEGMHTSPWLCFTSPCWLWLKVLRHGYVSIMIPQLAETDTGSSSVVTCSVLHAAGLPWNLQVLIVIQLSLRFNTQVTLVLTQKNDRLSCCNLEVGQED